MKHLNQKFVSVSSNTLLSTVRFFAEQMLNMGKMNESVVAARGFYGCYLAVLPAKGNQMFLTLILFEMRSSTEQINLSPSKICTDFESQIL